MDEFQVQAVLEMLTNDSPEGLSVGNRRRAISTLAQVQVELLRGLPDNEERRAIAPVAFQQSVLAFRQLQRRRPELLASAPNAKRQRQLEGLDARMVSAIELVVNCASELDVIDPQGRAELEAAVNELLAIGQEQGFDYTVIRPALIELLRHGPVSRNRYYFGNLLKWAERSEVETYHSGEAPPLAIGSFVDLAELLRNSYARRQEQNALHVPLE
jgi:hypothetical protein